MIETTVYLPFYVQVRDTALRVSQTNLEHLQAAQKSLAADLKPLIKQVPSSFHLEQHSLWFIIFIQYNISSTHFLLLNDSELGFFCENS